MAGLQQTQLGKTLQQGGGQTNTLTSQVATQQSAPLVVPVFPIRPAPPPTSSHYSPYSPSRFNFTLPWGANFAVYGRRNVAPSITQYDFVEFVKGGRVDHRLRKRDLSEEGFGSDEAYDLRPLSEFKFFHESRNSHKSDVLDSISDSYEGTRKILADSEPKGPFYIPTNNKIDYHTDVSSSADLPHPTVNIDILNEERHIISKREAEFTESMMVNVSLLQYLDTGRWFLSVYNDELQPYSVSLVISEADGVSTTCPNDCSGRGSCYLGKCDCIDGFQGIDCSKSKC
ncbi:hypothetical protein HUJ04_005329 [Dendroctonus ponderosae]|nr:hypothetical protein HUJ04_005329 [Dendroctonus ponderosae]